MGTYGSLGSYGSLGLYGSLGGGGGKALKWEISVFKGANVDGSTPDVTLLVDATVPNGFLDMNFANSVGGSTGFDDMIWDDTNIPTRTPTFTAGSDFVGVEPI
jgi:hypothetical protein